MLLIVVAEGGPEGPTWSFLARTNGGGTALRDSDLTSPEGGFAAGACRDCVLGSELTPGGGVTVRSGRNRVTGLRDGTLGAFSEVAVSVRES